MKSLKSISTHNFIFGLSSNNYHIFTWIYSSGIYRVFYLNIYLFSKLIYPQLMHTFFSQNSYNPNLFICFFQMFDLCIFEDAYVSQTKYMWFRVISIYTYIQLIPYLHTFYNITLTIILKLDYSICAKPPFRV
jgi:hypothetical protein